MKAYRIDITSWTASFRYPNLLSGIQPTLDVPPVSTVLGILNAAAGKYLRHTKLEIGYYFRYDAKTFDLETIYQIESNAKGQPSNYAKSNVIQREFLFDVSLSIYLKDEQLVDYLRSPYYDILLGRSGDLAKVARPVVAELAEEKNARKIKGQLVPLQGNFLPGKIQALPKYFTDEFPRKNLGTEPYSLIPFNAVDVSTKLTGWRDTTQGRDGIDIYFHQLDFSSYV